MTNREVNLGYLIVHDARLEDFGKSVLDASVPSHQTIKEIFIDLRPRAPSRKARRA